MRVISIVYYIRVFLSIGWLNIVLLNFCFIPLGGSERGRFIFFLGGGPLLSLVSLAKRPDFCLSMMYVL